MRLGAGILGTPGLLVQGLRLSDPAFYREHRQTAYRAAADERRRLPAVRQGLACGRMAERQAGFRTENADARIRVGQRFAQEQLAL